jgi:hypothetical protein
MLQETNGWSFPSILPHVTTIPMLQRPPGRSAVPVFVSTNHHDQRIKPMVFNMMIKIGKQKC